MAAVTVEFAALLDRIVIPKKKRKSVKQLIFLNIYYRVATPVAKISNQLFDNSYYQKFIFTTYQLLSFEFQPENKEKDLEK